MKEITVATCSLAGLLQHYRPDASLVPVSCAVVGTVKFSMHKKEKVEVTDHWIILSGERTFYVRRPKASVHLGRGFEYTSSGGKFFITVKPPHRKEGKFQFLVVELPGGEHVSWGTSLVYQVVRNGLRLVERDGVKVS